MSTLQNSKILSTKLFVPKLKSYFINRNRINVKFDNILDYKLVLISAPAGFGKTTAVVSWLDSLNSTINSKITTKIITKINLEENKKNIISWLSLDISDNDINRFINYLVFTINQSDATILPISQTIIKSTNDFDLENILIVFLNEIAECNKQIIIVLDDYHNIENKEINTSLNYILENAPNNLHFIITSRVDPSLNLGRLKANGEIIEIRANDLRFSKNETQKFLSRIVNKEFNDKQIQRLKVRTEGWAVGIQLAAIAMQSKTNLDDFINNFSGNNVYIIEYLTEEVLNNQSQEIQEFLIMTSIFKRFNADLANFVLQKDNSYEIIDTLFHSNMFLIPLDENKNWWRYHHLFSDLLQFRLKSRYQNKYIELFQRATEWLFENKLYNEAFEYSIKAEDYGLASKVFEELATIMITNGEINLVINLANNLPNEFIEKYPFVSILLAWASCLTGNLENVKELVNNVEKLLQNPNDFTTDLVQELEAHLILIKTIQDGPIYTRNPNDLDTIHQQALLAKSKIKEDNYLLHSTIEQIIGESANISKKWAKAEESLYKSFQLGVKAENYYIASIAARNYTECLIRQLKIEKAYEFLDEFSSMPYLYINNTESPLKAFFYESKGKIEFLKNNIEESNRLFKIAYEQGIKIFNRIMIMFSSTSLSESLLYLDQFDNSLEIINSTKKYQNSQIKAIWELKTLNIQAKYIIYLNNLGNKNSNKNYNKNYNKNSKNNELSNNLTELNSIYYQIQNNSLIKLDEYVRIYNSRIAIELELFDEAENSLKSLFDEYLANEALLYLSIVELYLSILYFKKHKQNIESNYKVDFANYEKGKNHLANSINIIYKSGFSKNYINEGNLVYEPLKEIILHINNDNKLQFNFVSLLINTIKLNNENIEEKNTEGMSEREIDVLKLLSLGMTNQEIGDKLFVALGTIKKHTNSIYNKLEVANRTQAITRAKEIGII